MTKHMLAIFSILPLAFVVGCGPTDNDCTGDECEGTADCVDNDCTGLDPDFTANVRMVAPYGWTGTFWLWADDARDDPACEDVAECLAETQEVGALWADIDDETFMCVSQSVRVEETQAGQTVDAVDQWLGEGVCGLAPEGDYGMYDVSTDLGSGNGYDQVWINFGSRNMAPITGADFFYEDTERLLEGAVSEDLTTIEYHRVVYNEDGSVYNEREGTLTLQD